MKKIALFFFLCLLGFAPHSFSENVADGVGALNAVTTGEENTGIGGYALPSLTTGHGNTALGAYAGRSALTVNGGVYLGYGAGATNTSAHKLYIQTMFYPTLGIFGDFSTGYFGINNSSPTVELDVTGSALISGTLGLTGALTLSDRVVISDSLLVSKEQTPIFADSSLALTVATGNPTVAFKASDGDASNITVNTSDQILFQSASNGYKFDGSVVLSNDETVSNSVNGTIALGGKVVAVGDTMAFSAEAVVEHASEADTSSVVFVGGKANVYGTDGDTYSVGITTGDAATFSGAGGGYSFDGTISLQNSETITNAVNGTIALGGKVVAVGDSIALSAEALVEHVSEADTSSVVFVGGSANVYGADGDTYSVGITTGDAANFTGATGGYLFDAVIDGTDISGTTIGAATPSTGAFTTITASGNVKATGDSIIISKEFVPIVADSSMAFVIKTGNPSVELRASDGDQSNITVDTEDRMVFGNALGGYSFDSKIIGASQNVALITATPDSAYATGTLKSSGTLFVARPLGQKSTLQLPAAVAGLTYDVMVADADSLLIQVTSGDSLITSAGAAWVTTSSVAGTVKLTAIDTVRWLMVYTLGTWTSY